MSSWMLLSSVASAQALGGFVQAEQGLYANTIADVSLTIDYVEICWPAGSSVSDVHLGGGATVGGNCAPGDLGFVVTAEDHPNGAQNWLVGKAFCRGLGMRLPEPEEAHLISCAGAGLGLSGLTDDLWASNHPAMAGDGLVVDFYVPFLNACGDLEASPTQSHFHGNVFCVR